MTRISPRADSFQTVILYSESVERFDSAIFSSIVRQIADKFIEDHYEEIAKAMDIASIANTVGVSVAARIEKNIMDKLEVKDAK